MKNDVKEMEVRRAVAITESAADIICAASVRASEVGRTVLRDAHCYLYAALLVDFVRAAKQNDWIGPSVRMADSSIKPTDQFLMDHMFGTVLAPLAQRNGGAFLDNVKRRAAVLVAAIR